MSTCSCGAALEARRCPGPRRLGAGADPGRVRASAARGGPRALRALEPVRDLQPRGAHAAGGAPAFARRHVSTPRRRRVSRSVTERSAGSRSSSAWGLARERSPRNRARRREGFRGAGGLSEGGSAYRRRLASSVGRWDLPPGPGVHDVQLDPGRRGAPSGGERGGARPRPGRGAPLVRPAGEQSLAIPTSAGSAGSELRRSVSGTPRPGPHHRARSASGPLDLFRGPSFSRVFSKRFRSCAPTSSPFWSKVKSKESHEHRRSVLPARRDRCRDRRGRRGPAIGLADDRAARQALRGGVRRGRRRAARGGRQLVHRGAAPGGRGARPRRPATPSSYRR